MNVLSYWLSTSSYSLFWTNTLSAKIHNKLFLIQKVAKYSSKHWMKIWFFFVAISCVLILKLSSVSKWNTFYSLHLFLCQSNSYCRPKWLVIIFSYIVLITFYYPLIKNYWSRTQIEPTFQSDQSNWRLVFQCIVCSTDGISSRILWMD